MELLIHQLFSQKAAQIPHKAALQIKRGDRWERWSYKKLHHLSRCIAAFLKERGYECGDRAIILLENCPEWVVLYLGILRAGLICVPLDVQMHPREIEGIVVDCGAKVIFCSERLQKEKITPTIRSCVREVSIISERISEQLGHVPLADEYEDAERTPLDTASLIYTSGTTGLPKAVMLSHANICSNFLSCAQLNLAHPQDNFIAVLPLHHTYPFMVTVIVPLLTGATVTFAPAGFKPEALSSFIRESEVTILTGVPQLFSVLYHAVSSKLSHIPRSLRWCAVFFIRRRIRKEFGPRFRLAISGGARLDPEIGRGLRRCGVLIVEGYGLTEASPVVTFNPLRRPRYGSAGKAVPQVKVSISNPDAKGEGEVIIQGPNVMKGYFKHDDSTREAIRDGWLYSGDRGYIDKHGFLYITGREKEVIVLDSGKNIYPQELENYYAQSPYIKELCIVEKTQHVFGSATQVLFAVIVPDFDYFRSQREAQIHTKIRWELENLGKKLPSYQHIMGFMLSKDPLPRTALNKIQRYKVKEKYLEGDLKPMAASDEAYSEEDKRFISERPAPEIMAYLNEQLKKPVYLDSHLELDLGLDSLSRVELALGLEKRFGIEIPDEMLYAVSTVKDFIQKIKEAVPAAQRAGSGADEHQEFSWQKVLNELPSREVLERIRIKTDFFDWFMLIFFKMLFSCIVRVFWLLRVRGKRSIPFFGPCLICPNHASYLDGIFVFASLPISSAMNTYFLGYQRIFEHPLLRWALKRARLIPLDPDTDLINALRAVSYVISQKKTVCIFPEGGRSVDDKMNDFKKGVGIIMKELDVKAVAVYIKNSHKSWPRTRRFPRLCRVRVSFGAPVSSEELLKAERGMHADEYQAIARGLQRKVAALR